MSPNVTSVPVTTTRHMPLGSWWRGIQPALNTLACVGRARGNCILWEYFMYQNVTQGVAQCHVFFSHKTFSQNKPKPLDKTIPAPTAWTFPHAALLIELPVGPQPKWEYWNNQSLLFKKKSFKKRKICSWTKLLHLWTVSSLSIR